MLTKTINFNDSRVIVCYEYHSATRGEREQKTGLQLEPDEDASIEITDIRCLDCLMSLLPESVQNEIAEHLLKLSKEPEDDGI